MLEIYLQRLSLMLERINYLKLDEPSLTKRMHILQNQLASPEFSAEVWESGFQEIEQLINNLRLAQEACEYVDRRMKAANMPLSLDGMRILEHCRTNINDIHLRQIFNRFKTRREEIGYPEFEQTAFRKGTGYSIIMHISEARSMAIALNRQTAPLSSSIVWHGKRSAIIPLRPCIAFIVSILITSPADIHSF
ncbi:hypothetical protein Lbir_2833 [Legionella birminghamensis]|uniref:Uncharacterized protein n=1 Tax=Legionella birminghamensis TaxID=28083 RepID=A0A378I765_9GAMM|nr:hypothetical protein [Legionella birminghamensis]KTC68231.1 hypothetical protein Lbir_2833 [Legionella birminghamensis]STX31058.1 Uncharacterised protein [Legionella birminghamensis]